MFYIVYLIYVRNTPTYLIFGIFHLPNPSGRTVALNRIEYQEYSLGGKGGQCVGLTTLPPSCAE